MKEFNGNLMNNYISVNATHDRANGKNTDQSDKIIEFNFILTQQY